MGGEAPELPLWLVYLGGTIGVAVGAAVYIFGVLKSRYSGEGKPQNSNGSGGGNSVEVAGALVDNGSIDRLAGEMAGNSLSITGQTAAVNGLTEALKDHTRAVNKLEEELQEVRSEMRVHRNRD